MKTLSGLAASTGIAIGPLFIYRPVGLTVKRRRVGDPEAENQRYLAARTRVAEALRLMAERLENDGQEEEAAIFEIQIEFLEDPTYGEAISDRILGEAINAEGATAAVGAELIEEFSEVEDDYFAQRTADIDDLNRRLLKTLMGVTDDPLAQIAEPSIVLATDLTPSDTASIDRDRVLALVTEVGSATSHTAILSRGLGIPSIVGLGELPQNDGVQAIVDAVKGLLIIDPDPQTLSEYQKRKADFDARRGQLVAEARKPAVTIDGHEIEMVANIGNVAEARQSMEFGAEGVGLLRTEFLFLERPELPSEDEQYQIYRQIVDVYGQRPVIVRTLDVGGDKNLPSVEMPVEQNPFLGQRAIRLALADQDRLLIPQLKALLRAAVDRNVKIMFPMVATAGEIRNLQAGLAAARTELNREGVPFGSAVEIGIMVEIPAAAVSAHRLAPLVDFFSIGTNDLTQYTLAADRTNERVAALADYFDPAVLDLIRMVIDGAHSAGKWVGMCGEMAGDPLAIPLLLGLGLDEFSMSPSAVPDAKDRVRRLSREECRVLAGECLECTDASAVRSLLEARSG